MAKQICWIKFRLEKVFNHAWWQIIAKVGFDCFELLQSVSQKTSQMIIINKNGYYYKNIIIIKMVNALEGSNQVIF